MQPPGSIVVLDFGSQYTQLIARRIRERNVYSAIVPYDLPLDQLRAMRPAGLVLSGGPSSVYDNGAPLPTPELYRLGVPVLGICYGLQLIAHQLGGRVEPAERREYGRAQLEIERDSCLLGGLPSSLQVWMSHGDRVMALPPGFRIVAHTENALAAIENPEQAIYAVQFHPEVRHTDRGSDILAQFVFAVCRARPNWTRASFIDETVAEIRKQVGGGRAIAALSGGVDSAVAATLVDRAIGDRLTSIFVDNGLLRKGEFESVLRALRDKLGRNVKGVDASRRFLERLAGVVDPEEKRRIIGHEFIAVLEEEARALGAVNFLVQGTLYPDVIESTSVRGPSARIKTHHNVGGLPATMQLALIEPLRELFKDEVRAIGRELGLPSELLQRQPFPGPGLAVRVVGEITGERLRLVREADEIIEQEVRDAGLYEALWQAFGVLLPVHTVGVMGDARTYAYAVAVRAVHSQDGMTADWAPLPQEVLGRIANRIVNEVPGVNRVVFDITSKPPGTIEWE